MTTSWWLDPMLVPLHVLGTGSLLLALWLWKRPASTTRWTVVGHLGLALFAAANAAYGWHSYASQEAHTFWLPPLLNAGAYLLLVVLPSQGTLLLAQGVRAVLHGANGRKGGAGLVFVAGVGFAAWLVATQADPSHLLSADDLLDSDALLAETALKTNPVPSSPLCTDQGRVVAVALLENPSDSLAQLFECQLAMLQRQGLFDQVIHLPLGWQNCNCHGYVFTAGHYCLGGDDVPLILADNGYVEVARPRAGDVAVYRDDTGKVLHTAIVRGATGEGIVVVESKWGRVGRFVHRADVHCYNDASSCLYYRSPREGHQLRGIYTSPPVSAPLEEMYEHLEYAVRGSAAALPAIETPAPRVSLASDE